MKYTLTRQLDPNNDDDASKIAKDGAAELERYCHPSHSAGSTRPYYPRPDQIQNPQTVHGE